MASRVRSVLAAAGRAAMVVLAVMLVTAMATGWLYWLRVRVAHWPGPRVRDALPLDELAGHDSVPLIVFAVAFGIAGAILGLVARAARLDRLAAGLGLAAGVGAWLFIADTSCLFFVRQVPMEPALRAAAGLQPVYLAAALAGACGALLGRSTGPGRITPHGSQYLPEGFARWFPASVLSIAAIGLIWAAWVWVRPWRQRLFPSVGDQEHAEDIVRRWGGDTLAPFALRLDK
jgi:lysylphosphatidylglycerol synthetase-like protein (DUF2156 family)